MKTSAATRKPTALRKGAPRGRGGGFGYLVVLLGIAGFVLSCFLPYTQFFDQVSISYYRLATASRGGTLEYVGGLLLLFGGTATVAWVALAGLRHGQHERRQTPSILLAVTVVWSLSWIGVVVSVSGLFGHEVGYWSMLVSVGVVIAGTVVVWVSARPTKHEPDSSAGPEPPTEVPVGWTPGSPCGAGLDGEESIHGAGEGISWPLHAREQIKTRVAKLH